MSLSARRAWIEIPIVPAELVTLVVALRKESVDRNGMEINGVSYDVWSLSARRAWIEIACPKKIGRLLVVALRKESVDRNKNTKPTKQAESRRSPQGERG